MLDINMLILNGLETLEIVKEKFEKINEKLNRRIAIEMAFTEDASLPNPPHLKVMRPMICYLSQQDRDAMRHFIRESEKAEYYLEKPLALKELASLLRLINVI